VLPVLSLRFGLGPRDVNLPPEQGGLTWDQLTAYVERLDDWPEVILGAVYLAEKG
jgi:hypothetical protein